jgi:hypothetical protein
MSATETPTAPAEAPKGPVIELIPLGQNLGRVVLTISNQGSLARFQQELQTLGQHFGRIQQLQQRVQSALTTVERDALSKVGEAEVKDFAEKDAVFAKVWGFNVPAVANRQATFVNTALRLFAVISARPTRARRRLPWRAVPRCPAARFGRPLLSFRGGRPEGF